MICFHILITLKVLLYLYYVDTEEKFRHIESELKPYRSTLAEAADAIIDKQISSYPIFVVHRLEVDIGLPLINREDVAGNWSVNASTLEEFVTKKIIEMEKLQDFRQIYKDPSTHLCLFLLSDFGATFVFLPRR